MSRPLSVPLTRRQLALAAGLGALLPPGLSHAAPPYPVTSQQRNTAQQVASQGVPLSELAPNAPDSYTVKRGDTLWGISSLFLRSPWRWPELWGMNLEQIRNPHLIYPGQLLVLVKGDGYAKLAIGQPVDTGTRDGQLHPHVREIESTDLPISSVPMHLLMPFLNDAVVFEQDQLTMAPRIAATQEGRMLVSRGEEAYVRGDVSGARQWQIFRPARPIIDPDNGVVLGYEGRHVGVAQVTALGDTTEREDDKVVHPSTVVITQLREEATLGDRLLPLPDSDKAPFVPHAPAQPLSGRVAAIYGDSLNAGQNQIVILNRGAMQGVERGHVLALWRAGRQRMDTTSPDRITLQLPDQRSGLMFVFRVYQRASFALILQTNDPVRVGERFTAP
ncbi:LysM peptidoglycan-binding domain-containing protein [Vitreoscilla filiformis]|jgi:LysM domain|uniref:LysM peptidoglycan-binding domain-containing protein n=1 Tax=Vitreoscilla filiformis TaxID=63 RepID=UPI000B79C71E|nr:LysM domain-containing protein [Vitreoscilla filiformis]